MVNEKLKLDKYDYKILSFLEENANRSINILSKKINKSREFCDYRIKRLKSEKIITEISASINPKKLGYATYNFLFKLQEIDNNKLKEFENFLIKSVYTKFVSKNSGNWDYEVSILVKEIDELRIFLDELNENFSINIKENNFHLRTKTIYFGSFLKVLGKKESFRDSTKINPKKKEVKKVNSKNKKEYILDELDYRILEILSIDATDSVKELTLKLDSTFDKIRYRLDKLKSNNFISSITAKINQNFFDYQVYSVTLKLKNLNKLGEKNLKKFFARNKYIFLALRIIGNWDIKLQVLAKDQIELSSFIDSLRDELKEDLKYYSFSIKLDTLKTISFMKR